MSFSLDLLQEDAESFRNKGMAVLITGSSLKGDIAIVPSGTDSVFFKNHTCYTPEEVLYVNGLDENEAVRVHELKRMFGGSVIPK